MNKCSCSLHALSPWVPYPYQAALLSPLAVGIQDTAARAREFSPGLFGLAPAARHPPQYFGDHTEDICREEPLESALDFPGHESNRELSGRPRSTLQRLT